MDKNFLPTPIISVLVTEEEKQLYLKNNVRKATYCVNQTTKTNQSFWNFLKIAITAKYLNTEKKPEQHLNTERKLALQKNMA